MLSRVVKTIKVTEGWEGCASGLSQLMSELFQTIDLGMGWRKEVGDPLEEGRGIGLGMG